LLNNSGNGYASLSWNPMRNPLPSTHNPWYLIYREYPAGIFTLIDSIYAPTAPTPMTFSDQITICDDTIKYRIEVRDSSGCSSFSAIKGDRFADRIPPAIAVIDSVSLDNAGNAIISWYSNPSFDTYSYVIIQPASPVSPEVYVDTVYGLNSTVLFSSISGNNDPQTFQVIAIDSCNNPTAPSAIHTSVFLQTNFDPCSRSSILEWTPYDFWGVQPLYQVLVSVNGGAEIVLDSTMLTTYTDTLLASGSTYCYRVRALDTVAVKSVTSNRVCVTPNFPPPPAFCYLRKVTILSEDQVTVTAYVDAAAVIDGYLLYRSNSPTGPFVEVAAQYISGVSSVTFTDNVPTNIGPYYYQVVAVDSCGNHVRNSQVSQSIFLSGVAAPEFKNFLDWTFYADWPTGVSRYVIYQEVDGVNIPLMTLTSLDSSYIDEVIGKYYSGGEFCYFVEAIESSGNPNFFIDTSRSNIICLEHEPVIFIPNAFHPGGVWNEIFYPSNGFVSEVNYSLEIFNRWGEMIFKTNDPYEGWDGVTNGRSAPEGVYVYRLKAMSPTGSDIERVGSVTLIR